MNKKCEGINQDDEMILPVTCCITPLKYKYNTKKPPKKTQVLNKKIKK